MHIRHGSNLKHINRVQIKTKFCSQSYYRSEIIIELSVRLFSLFFSFSFKFILSVQSPNIEYLHSEPHYHKHSLFSFMLLGKKNNSSEQPTLTIFFQVRWVITYCRPSVANDDVIYFPGHCRGIDKCSTPEGEVILNTSSSLTLAVSVAPKPSTYSNLNYVLSS